LVEIVPECVLQDVPIQIELRKNIRGFVIANAQKKGATFLQNRVLLHQGAAGYLITPM
jgi:hypothetical protein